MPEASPSEERASKEIIKATQETASETSSLDSTCTKSSVIDGVNQFPIFEAAFPFQTVSVVNSPISATSSSSEISSLAFSSSAIYQNSVSLTAEHSTTPRALVMATTNSSTMARGRKRTATSRLPAKLKEPAAVARRNARERRRVKMVNDGFLRLRKHVPTDPKNKKLSKVKTLRLAIDYIKHLQQLLVESSVKQSHSNSSYNNIAGIPDELDTNPSSWLHPENLVSNFAEFSSNFTLV